MNFSEKWGTDVEEAVRLALVDLKLERDQVEVTVLEEPSKGFFGIGSKLAKVRVEPKKVEEKIEEETKTPEIEIKREAKESPEKKPDRRKKEKSSNRREKRKSLVPREPEENLELVTEHPALAFLDEITEKMGLTLEMTAKKGVNSLYIDIQGKDSGTIIGKRGQTLDAIQYLTSLVVNKDTEKYIRVVIDAENYRSKRERTLEQLANRLADKVVRTKKSVRLEPMNPYERKVIHATLQGNPNVTTKSEGEEPYRRVIIELTK
ncbi:protein jag [Clostridiales bacterium]|nr:protein jag [Clostridiales bacterium]